ncbi:hypothetical protein ACD578_05300 [Microvirga sp. RSM25]|uniref:hypothetical protein n=1 Tax=Microvirga sp. RSM25 TaxID=3273802 RepID=UPI00384C6D3B
MAVWSWKDVDWGPGGPPDYIKIRLSPIGPRTKSNDGQLLPDNRPRQPRFRLTSEGEQQVVARLTQGESAEDVATDLRVPSTMVEAASRRAGPHDCAYGCGPTQTTPVGLSVATDNTVRQRVKCSCGAGKCWTRITVRERA